MHNAPSTDYGFMRLPEVLAVFRISRTQFYKLIQQGTLPKPKKIGRSSFWTREEVKAAYDRLAQPEQA